MQTSINAKSVILKLLATFLAIFILMGCYLNLEPFSGRDKNYYPFAPAGELEHWTDDQKLTILNKYAPIFYHNTRNDNYGSYKFHRTGDFMIRINFDNNWSSIDNWDHCIVGNTPGNIYGFDFRGFVYGTLVATKSHFYLGYQVYHAMDDAVLAIDRHQNDMENVLLVIDRSNDLPVGMVANKHGWDMCYSNDYKAKNGKFIIEEDRNGFKRATCYISANGDGPDAGHGIEAWKGKNRHLFVKDMVRYDPTLANEVPVRKPEVEDRKLWGETGYEIILMEDETEGFWRFRTAQSGPDNPFYRPGAFYGGGYAPGGHTVFNPIYIFEEALSDFSAVTSKEYTSNTYLRDYLDAPYLFDDFDFANVPENFTPEEQEDILDEFAPFIYQNTRQDKYISHQYYRANDFPVAVDFDGDWSSKNNRENAVKGKDSNNVEFDFTGAIYGTLVTTESHYFIGYHVYHTQNDAYLAGDRHDNDMETIYLIVERPSKIVAIQVVNESRRYSYSNDYSSSNGHFNLEKDVDGKERVAIYISSNGDGSSFGHTIEPWKGYGNHSHIQHLVRYSPLLAPSVPGIDPSGEMAINAGYQVILMRDSERGLWQFREQDKEDFLPFGGEETAFYDGVKLPWSGEEKELFINPVKTFPNIFEGLGEVLYPAYTFNPYVKELKLKD